MPRTADAHTALVDTARIRRIRDAEAERFAAPFEAAKAKAARNLAAFNRPRTFALA